MVRPLLDWFSSVMLQCTKPVKIVDHVIQPDVPRDACSNTAKTAKKRRVSRSTENSRSE